MTVEFISQSISTEVWHQAGVVLATPGPAVRLTYWDTQQSLKCLVAYWDAQHSRYKISGSRYVSDCRSRVREFDPGPVPYFQGDCRSWNIYFYDHSLPSTDLRRVCCQFQAKEYVQEVLVNC